MTIRIGLGEVSQESGSFLPAPSDLERFRRGVLLFGAEMEQELREGERELGGAARAARARGAEIVPLLAAQAFALGPAHRRDTTVLRGGARRTAP